LEPNPPTKNLDGTWTHRYDPVYAQQIKDAIVLNRLFGIYSLLDNHPCTDNIGCSFFGYPIWLYQAPYNSKATTYSQTADGAMKANTDFWSDALRQRFVTDLWEFLAGQLVQTNGVLGYEIMNEPQKGSLPNQHTTTQLLLDWQLGVAQAIRAIDPARVVVFATRAGYGPGLATADLSGWRALAGTPVGNVAFDLHDYFGGRWGDGLVENLENPEYQETVSILFDHVLDDAAGPYIGTTEGHVRFVGQAVQRLGDIPLLVGEFGDEADDPGILVYFGTTTSAFNYLGVSWAASYGGRVGILAADGTLTPWGRIVVDAVAP
jgi:hypothetical protein